MLLLLFRFDSLVFALFIQTGEQFQEAIKYTLVASARHAITQYSLKHACICAYAWLFRIIGFNSTNTIRFFVCYNTLSPLAFFLCTPSFSIHEFTCVFRDYSTRVVYLSSPLHLISSLRSSSGALTIRYAHSSSISS